MVLHLTSGPMASNRHVDTVRPYLSIASIHHPATYLPITIQAMGWRNFNLVSWIEQTHHIETKSAHHHKAPEADTKVLYDDSLCCTPIWQMAFAKYAGSNMLAAIRLLPCMALNNGPGSSLIHANSAVSTKCIGIINCILLIALQTP